MKKVFGEKSGERSHTWLTKNFGYSHVSDLPDGELDRCITGLNNIKVVRPKTWEKLEKADSVIAVQNDISRCKSRADTFKGYLQACGLEDAIVKVYFSGTERAKLEMKFYEEGDDLAIVCGYNKETEVNICCKEIEKFDKIFEAYQLVWTTGRRGRFNYKQFQTECANKVRAMSLEEAIKLFAVIQKNYSLAMLVMKNRKEEERREKKEKTSERKAAKKIQKYLLNQNEVTS
jgi:hypothetical protein